MGLIEKRGRANKKKKGVAIELQEMNVGRETVAVFESRNGKRGE